MSDLIVDFPRRGSTSTKRVQFSTTSSLKFVKRIEDMADASKVWYSSKDYKSFRAENKRSLQNARKALDAISASDLEMKEKVRQTDVIDMTGIENMITPTMIKRAIAHRAEYFNAVLNEQDQQESAGIFDADKLAKVSSQHSKSSRRRAQNIGKLHSKR